MAVDRCSKCHTSLGTMTQWMMFNTPLFCASCQRDKQAGDWMRLLPNPEERAWAELSEWKQQFLTSVREQYERRGTVSEKQFSVLQRVYEKVR